MAGLMDKFQEKPNIINIFCFFLLFIIGSLLVWKLDEWLKWQWLINHPNRLLLKIATHVVLFCIALLLICKKKEAIRAQVSLIVTIASVIIPLLSPSEKSHEAKQPKTIIDSSLKPIKSKPIHNGTNTSKRTIFLSGRVIDIFDNSPLDSVMIMINYIQVGHSNSSGIFNIQYQPDQFYGITNLQFIKKGYEILNESKITTVKDEDIYFNDKLIELKKVK